MKDNTRSRKSWRAGRGEGMKKKKKREHEGEGRRGQNEGLDGSARRRYFLFFFLVRCAP